MMWYDTLKIDGDFRYRHETIDAEFSSNRHRQRIRARAQLAAEVSDSVDVGLGIASGGDDPVGTSVLFTRATRWTIRLCASISASIRTMRARHACSRPPYRACNVACGAADDSNSPV